MKYDIKEVCPVPPPYGGVTVYVDRLIKQLTKDGYKVGGYYSAECSDKSIISSPMFDKWTWMQTALLPLKIWKYFREALPYKIIHSHFSLEGMPYFWLIKLLERKRFVFTIHNSMNENYWKQTNFLNRFFLKRMLRDPSIIWITVSEQGKEQLAKLSNISLDRIKVIPPYVPQVTKYYEPLGEEIQNYIDRHDKIIVFYGHSFMQNNGVDIYGFDDTLKLYYKIIKVYNQSVGLVICISDSSDHDKILNLHQRAIKDGIDELIFWQIGAISNIRTLWRQADVYIRPTSTDGDSVAIREVLDEGALVVASDVCIRPDGVICYHYSDPNDFLEKVLYALSLPRNKVAPNFKPYIEIKNIYQELLL